MEQKTITVKFNLLNVAGVSQTILEDMLDGFKVKVEFLFSDLLDKEEVKEALQMLNNFIGFGMNLDLISFDIAGDIKDINKDIGMIANDLCKESYKTSKVVEIFKVMKQIDTLLGRENILRHGNIDKLTNESAIIDILNGILLKKVKIEHVLADLQPFAEEKERQVKLAKIKSLFSKLFKSSLKDLSEACKKSVSENAALIDVLADLIKMEFDTSVYKEVKPANSFKTKKILYAEDVTKDNLNSIFNDHTIIFRDKIRELSDAINLSNASHFEMLQDFIVKLKMEENDKKWLLNKLILKTEEVPGKETRSVTEIVKELTRDKTLEGSSLIRNPKELSERFKRDEVTPDKEAYVKSYKEKSLFSDGSKKNPRGTMAERMQAFFVYKSGKNNNSKDNVEIEIEKPKNKNSDLTKEEDFPLFEKAEDVNAVNLRRALVNVDTKRKLSRLLSDIIGIPGLKISQYDLLDRIIKDKKNLLPLSEEQWYAISNKLKDKVNELRPAKIEEINSIVEGRPLGRSSKVI